jgi:hypothetical protein
MNKTALIIEHHPMPDNTYSPCNMLALIHNTCLTNKPQTHYPRRKPRRNLGISGPLTLPLPNAKAQITPRNAQGTQKHQSCTTSPSKNMATTSHPTPSSPPAY